MPSLPKPDVLQLIRSSCREVVAQHSAHVSVSETAVADLVTSLPWEDVAASVHGTVFPMRFDDVQSEVTFLALYHLLDFGSGYNHVLQQRNLRDAHETIQFGCIGMRLGTDRMDHHWMKAFSNYSVHNFFGIDCMDEHELSPGISISKPGILHPLTRSLRAVVNATGAALEALSQRSLGQNIEEHLEGQCADGRTPSAAALITHLAQQFSGFEDVESYEGVQVTFMRKAQALVLDLHARFASRDPRFAFSDIHALTGDSGSLLPAILRTMGILTYSPELGAAVDAATAGVELPAGPHELALRAAAVTAVDTLARASAAAGHLVSASQLSCFLLAQAESGGPLCGKVVRHLTRTGVAY
ncbi:MAG: hypothetical protein WDW38_005363 [Sanguina aurantia]